MQGKWENITGGNIAFLKELLKVLKCEIRLHLIYLCEL